MNHIKKYPVAIFNQIIAYTGLEFKNKNGSLKKDGYVVYDAKVHAAAYFGSKVKMDQFIERNKNNF